MYEEGPDENESDRGQKAGFDMELVSIRKKLIEPNKILPAAMMRSQPPRHIVPLPPQQSTRSGHRMPLDPYPEQQNESPSPSTRRRLSPHGKFRSKSQLPEFKRREQFKLNQQDKLEEDNEADLLQFLHGSIRNILEYPQNIAFMSRTAFLSNLKTNKYKPRLSMSSQDRREECIQYLKGNRHFAATTYAFDQPSSDDHLIQSLNFDEHLQFYDDFQSSNLYLAMHCDTQLMNTYRKPAQKHQALYLLTVRLDYNTKSYGQWFYFKVKRKGSLLMGQRSGNSISYKFMIINMTKNSSLFGSGLKVSVCRDGLWGKQGQNIRYYRNSLRREDPINIETEHSIPSSFNIDYYSTLEFTLNLSLGQQIYISYNQPYSYSRVGRLLDKITSKYQQNQHNIINLKRTQLCNTYLSNAIQVLTLSARRIAHPLHLSIDDKKVIFIMARTHPVETAGSHVIEGILNQIYRLFIQSPKEEHRSHLLYKLLQQYILKIIPMANPDGVILGNSRCNLPGYDLNRCWKGPKFEKSKQIYYIKRHVFLYHRRLQMFLDLHAHSKKKNVFAYGCHDTADPFSSRQFPYLLSKLSRQDFLFQECRFTRLADPRHSQQKKSTKDGTARVFLYDSLRIPNIFTIQNSYCSAKNSVYHYDRHSYGVIGADILTAVSLYFSPNFKNEWPQREKRQEEKGRSNTSATSQNHIKISLNTTFINDLQLKLTINSQKPRSTTTPVEEELSKCKNINQLRDRYLCQLRQREENIKVGLQKDNDVSESEEEERIYEPNPKKKEKEKNHSQTGLRKTKGQAKTDRLLNYINKNTGKVSPQKSNKQSILNVSNISSTYSQTNLARITKVNKDRLRTLTRQEQLVLIPDESCHENYSKDKRKLLSRRQRPPTQLQSTRREKLDNCLSIVQIGLDNEVQEKQLEQRIMVIDRFQAKDRLKTFHNFQQKPTHTKTEPKRDLYRQEQKDDEIKQYLRRIMKPKRLVGVSGKSRQHLVRLQEKNERTKQSQVQFNDLRMSKLVILQNHKQFRLNHQKSLHQ